MIERSRTAWRNVSLRGYADKFKVGDRVAWNSETGRVSGKIIKVHTRDFDYKGHRHHASRDDPQYEIQSDKSDHIAAHKGAALRKMRG
jgi:hypothetical protein